jgi:hypothetical protein
LRINENNWLYWDNEKKLKYVKSTRLYKIQNDSIIAYKAVKDDYSSVFNRQYTYKIGKKYKSHCDCNMDEDGSFGLSAWTKAGALNYYNKGKLLKVRIPIDGLGCVVQEDKKLRCFELEILEEIL